MWCFWLVMSHSWEGTEKEMEYKEQNSHLDETPLETENEKERERATGRDQTDVFARFCEQMISGIYGG